MVSHLWELRKSTKGTPQFCCFDQSIDPLKYACPVAETFVFAPRQACPVALQHFTQGHGDT